jgi:acyl-CoA synthetase (NDP forming)
VAAKALGLSNKSDSGGVALDLNSADSLRAEVQSMQQRLGAEGFSIEQMVTAPDSLELIVGGVRDPRFGPLVMVGIGGVLRRSSTIGRLVIAPMNAEIAQ